MKRKEGERLKKNLFEEKEEVRKTRKKQLVGDVTMAAAEEISINATFQHLQKEKKKKSPEVGHVSTLLPTGFSKC